MPDFKFDWDAFYKRQKFERIKRRMKNILKTVLGKEEGSYCIEESQVKKIGNEEIKEEWFFDPRNRIIEFPKNEVQNQPGKKTIARLLHELSHAKYTEIPEISNAPSEFRTHFMHLCNTLEDLRIERQLMYNYPGTYDSFKKNRERFQESAAVEHIMYAEPYINFLFNLGQQEWNLPIYAQKGILEIVAELKPELESVLKAPNTQALVDETYTKVWEKFYNLLIKNPPNSQGGGQGQAAQDNNAGDNQQDPQDQSAQGGGEGQTGEGNNQNQSQNQQKGGNSGEEEKIREKMKDLANKSITMEEIAEYLEEEGQKQGRKNKPTKKEQNDNVDGRKAFGKDYENSKNANAKDQWKNRSRPHRTYEELFEAVQPQFHFFYKKLNSIMKDNQYTRQGGTFRSGKLNTKKLYKWKCNSGKLFSRPIIRAHKHYAITLLVDQSGSMSGNPINRAAEGAVLMAEVLHRINIPFEVAGFDDSAPRLYKKLSEPFTWEHRRNMEFLIPDGRGCTNDAFAINWCHSRLQQVNAERILIVLSDGYPNSWGGNIPLEDQKRLKKRHKKQYSDFDLKQEVMLASKDTSIIGIGIHSNAVEEYYPNWSVVREINQLPNEILHHVKANIRRG